MALRTPYENPPAGPHGELVLSMTADGAAQGDHTFYLVRRFEFAGGDYTFEAMADDAATFRLGTTQFDGRTFLSVQAEGGSTTINIPAGSYRLDVTLQNVPVAPNPCAFKLVITQGTNTVYASAKEGWLLDDAPISDSDLPPPADYRRSLPVFSVLPNWQSGVLERLSWLTDVMSSERDAEQRRSVRRNARRSFDANFLRQRSQRDRLDTFFVGTGAGEFMMPLWHEAVKLTDGLSMEASGVFFADGQLNMREFRTGDLVFVNAGNPDDYDILEVGDVEQMRFSWASPPPRAWPPGTRIYPMRVATLNAQAPRLTNITDTVATAAVRFELVEPYSVPPSWGAAVGGQPLFRFIPDRVTPLEVQYESKTFVRDNQSGIPFVTDHGRGTTAEMQMAVSLFGRANAYAFRQFLQAARGMARHFYMPTFTWDVEPLGDILSNSQDLMIAPQGFFDYMRAPQPIRLQLSFQFTNGSQTLYRTITGVTQVFKTNANGQIAYPPQTVAELLTLDTPLPAIMLRALRRVSFVVETRFAQDNFEILHRTNMQKNIQTSLVFRQARNPRDIT